MVNPLGRSHTGFTVCKHSFSAGTANDFGQAEADMENFWARQPLDAARPEYGSATGSIGDPVDLPHADDPLGDEAAFPSTWQHLRTGDASRD